ncbi:MAG: hypothetical protein ACLR6J_08650 [Parabacteroides merdae]
MVIIVQRYATNPLITQTIKEIFHQLERCLLAVLFASDITNGLCETKKFRFFVADTGKVLPDN